MIDAILTGLFLLACGAVLAGFGYLTARTLAGKPTTRTDHTDHTD